MNFLIYTRNALPLVDKLMELAREAGPIRIQTATDQAGFDRAYQECFSGETLILFVMEDDRDMEVLDTASRYFLDVKLAVYLVEGAGGLKRRAFGYYPRLVSGYCEPESRIMDGVAGILAEMTQAWKHLNSP